ncbi:MAG TPA: DUF354 domain-containing protein [Solirubrobacteraceae bacterium]
MRVWIDLSNSPHPLLFAPVARRLESEGHQVLPTARNNAQTAQLARERWPEVALVGGESPRGKAAKSKAIVQRMKDLWRWAASTRPDVALSHNSYAQIVASRSLGVPAVTAMDFEHQPANHLAFRLASVVLLPEALPMEAVRRQGANPRKVIRYPGLKEQLYIGDFEPNDGILAALGVHERPRILVVVRTPPSRAVYHPSRSPLFVDTLRMICGQDGVLCVALTRHPEQVTMIKQLRLRNCIVPRSAIDSRSLMYAADAMIGAGGTMTREAALMGIPTWTLFAGTTPAVDVWLESRGLLQRLREPADVGYLKPRRSVPHSPDELRVQGAAIERVIVDATLAAAGKPLPRDTERLTV